MTTINNHQYLTWAEIDLKAVRHNFQTLCRLARPLVSDGKKRKSPFPVPHTELLPVIKADAYGHGMLTLAGQLNMLGVKFFGVSDVPEGMALRKAGLKQSILLLETTLPSYVAEIITYNLTPSVCTHALAAALNNCAKTLRRKVNVHIKVDTGMGRLGVWYEEAKDFIRQVRRLPQLTIEGIFTHFPLADTDSVFTRRQIARMAELISELKQEGMVIPYIHAANSMGLSEYRMDLLNLARPGLMLYGLYPVERLKRRISLKPVMSVKTRIIYLKEVSKGRGLSYGHTFIAPRRMKVATLPMGYSDGYFRCLSNKSAVLVGGKRCPLVGRVTMDQIIVDVSAVKNVAVGQEAVILGRQKEEEISAADIAKWAGTIHYEIVCSLGNRLPRIYKR